MKKEMNWKGRCCEKSFYGIPIIGVILVLAVICISGCIGTGLASPIVSDVPNSWYISYELYYGEVEGTYNWNAGMIEFTDSRDADFVQIYYEYAPEDGLSHNELESDALYLLEEVLDFCEIKLEPSETGIMNIAGTEAGYAKNFDPETNRYVIEIVMILGEVYLDIYSCYDATSEDENQVMSLIESISVGK